MAIADRTPTDSLSDLRERSQRYELFQALRLIDAAHRDLPLIGEAAGPHDEAVRVGFDPALDFAAADFTPETGSTSADMLRLHARGFGLLGPNGPLPLSVTEQIRSALLHENDAAPLHFIEMLQHRLISLFYRAYAQARASIQADRPDSDHFALFLGALFGRHAAVEQRDDYSDESRLYFTGRYAAMTRSSESLEAMICHEFDAGAQVTTFALSWLHRDPEALTVLGRNDEGASLGIATIAGTRVQDRQSHIALTLGPLPLARFEDFLPTGRNFSSLAAMVREFTRGELFCRLRLMLRCDDVPPTILGEQGRLGHVSWLGRSERNHDVSDAEFTLC